MRICYNCGAELRLRERVPFKELCPKCDAFLHCCRNCRLYAPDAPNHCLSRTPEFVPGVESGNYCDEFVFREIKEEEDPAKSSADARDQKRSGNSSGSHGLTAREKFERLFKD